MKHMIILALLCLHLMACSSSEPSRWQEIDGELTPINPNMMFYEMSPVITKGDISQRTTKNIRR